MTEEHTRSSAENAKLADECDAWVFRNEAITIAEVGAKMLLSRAATALRATLTHAQPQTSCEWSARRRRQLEDGRKRPTQNNPDGYPND